MSDITIGVVAHIDRRDIAWQLAEDVGAQVFSYDDGTIGCSGNHIRVWTRVLQHGGDWGVVLEDDAKLFETIARLPGGAGLDGGGFNHQLGLILADPPADVVSLYLGRNYPKAWQRFIKNKMSTTDTHWLLSSHVLHCVGVAIRMHLVSDMLRFLGNMSSAERIWPVDEQITHWCRLRGHRVAYTRPSIIDHRDLPPLIDHSQIDGAKRELPRTAWEFGRRDVWDKTSTANLP